MQTLSLIEPMTHVSIATELPSFTRLRIVTKEMIEYFVSSEISHLTHTHYSYTALVVTVCLNVVSRHILEKYLR
jgi:hypothetical protein